MNRALLIALGTLFLACGRETWAHPTPDIPVRTWIEESGAMKIHIEIDPRCFDQDPTGAPYLTHAELLKLPPEQQAELKSRARTFLEKTVAICLDGEDQPASRFEPEFTTFVNRPLADEEAPVMVTFTCEESATNHGNIRSSHYPAIGSP